MELEQQIYQQIANGLAEAIRAKLVSSYNNPLDKMIESVVSSRHDKIKGLLEKSIDEALGGDFGASISEAVRDKVAKVMISKAGGEIEKKLNDLRSDAMTRAKITLALEKAVSSVLK